jgi:FkbM family methyltransferase
MTPKSTAEFQTDLIVWQRYFQKELPGLVVEVGAADPVFLSMSSMWHQLGCRCVCIEPNPIFAARHRQAGNNVLEVAISDHNADGEEFTIIERAENAAGLTAECASALKIDPRHNLSYLDGSKRRTIRVCVRTLDSLILEHINLLCVDVEGSELAVMRGLTDNPDVVVLENFPEASPDPEYEAYMRKRGYRLDHSVRYNQIYVRA